MQQLTDHQARVKFATQADPEVLAALRAMAATEGRQIQALVDEALREYIERKQEEKPRRHVLQAFQSSVAKYDSLYKELAK
ncbi:conserved hypothetical protein [uncultured delta proteobacterium]|uniref:Ribbon-helix-helix protein CopG domain-containing protein n=1 Tax=uncultured delta proteobacterium TaxID=34034 RepID=A0A212JFC9_9DELT|nr:conserved hypothetical protein [uncultured delta proteobacterium]